MRIPGLPLLFPKKHALLVLGMAAVALATVVGTAFSFSCIVPKERVPQEGTQGYQTWYGKDIRSFYHRDRRVCVPYGWEAVGATAKGNLPVRGTQAGGWARWEHGKTGIVVRSAAFSKAAFSVPESNYKITLRYSASTSPSAARRYERAVEHAFARVGALFGDAISDSPVPHTVLVTAGLERDSSGEEIALYPDPRGSVTVLVQDPEESVRGEELLLHAVVHLYNRFNTKRTRYQRYQSPLSAADVEELEATWAETAFRTSEKGRAARLSYLYNVHGAVTTGNFALPKAPPFDDAEAFSVIRPGVVQPPGASELDIQYGHYVLGPLSMVGIDGLLTRADATADLEDILKRIHTGDADNLFAELARYLTDAQVKNIADWMSGKEAVPKSVIEAALEHYRDR